MTPMPESEIFSQEPTVTQERPDAWTDRAGEVRPLGKNYPIRVWEVPNEPEAVTVDIVEASRRPPGSTPRQGVETIHVPTYVVINGQSVYTPRGTKIEVNACGLDATTVTMTFFAHRVRIGHSDDLLAE